MEKKWQLLEPGTISEPIEIPFDIDLSKLINLRESYTGTNFQVTHAVGYYIARPWYTFPVYGDQMIHIRKGVPAAEVSEGCIYVGCTDSDATNYNRSRRSDIV